MMEICCQKGSLSYLESSEWHTPYASTSSYYKQVMAFSQLFSFKAVRPCEVLSKTDRKANSGTTEASSLNISK